MPAFKNDYAVRRRLSIVHCARSLFLRSLRARHNTPHPKRCFNYNNMKESSFAKHLRPLLISGWHQIGKPSFEVPLSTNGVNIITE